MKNFHDQGRFFFQLNDLIQGRITESGVYRVLSIIRIQNRFLDPGPPDHGTDPPVVKKNRLNFVVYKIGLIPFMIHEVNPDNGNIPPEILDLPEVPEDIDLIAHCQDDGILGEFQILPAILFVIGMRETPALLDEK